MLSVQENYDIIIDKNQPIAIGSVNMFISLNGIETAYFYEFKEWTNLNFMLHCHYAFEVVFVKSGRIRIEKEETTYRLTKGDSIAIMPFEKHSFITDESSQIFIFQISPSLISNWNLCFSGKTFKNSCRKFLDREIVDIYKELKSADGNIIGLNFIFFKIMNAFINDNELIESYKTEDICLEALRYVGENFRQNITLKDMAKELNMSYVYLSRVFVEKIKFKFVDCVNSFRIQEAIILLSNPNKSISEICFECGFGSLRQFNRLFLKNMLCTPSEYRKNMLK